MQREPSEDIEEHFFVVVRFKNQIKKKKILFISQDILFFQGMRRAYVKLNSLPAGSRCPSIISPVTPKKPSVDGVQFVCALSLSLSPLLRLSFASFLGSHTHLLVPPVTLKTESLESKKGPSTVICPKGVWIWQVSVAVQVRGAAACTHECRVQRVCLCAL